MKQLIIIISLLMFIETINSQPIPPDSLYFGETRPGDSAVIFAPGLISIPGRKEVRITFSPDGKTVVYAIEFWPNSGTPYTMITEYKNNRWSDPCSTSFTYNRMTNEPFFAQSGTRIYLIATNAQNQSGAVDISYVDRVDTSWGTPVSMGNPPNSQQYQYHPSIVGDNSIYFSAMNGEIAYSKYINGVYSPRVLLPFPVNYANTAQTWGDPYAAHDESYLIFKSTRTGGYGLNDVYISYRKANGLWTNPKNLGNKINTQYEDYSGDITPDGLYMTFMSNNDLYWVSTAFIERLRHTNFIPYLKNQIPNQTDTVLKNFSFTFSDSVFIDDDGNNTLTYSAALSSGAPLPAWLNFNPQNRTFLGIPPEACSLSIKITAVDTANASAYCTFNLNIINPIGIYQQGEQIINEYKLLQNYPNPFNPVTNIKFIIPKAGEVVLKLFNVLGSEMETIFRGYLKAGEYKVEYNAENLPSGVYYYVLKTNSFFETKKMVILK